MQRSETITQIATALAKAQSQIQQPAKGESVNTGKYRYTYADLASVWEALRVPLTSNGLSVVQSPSSDGNTVIVETVLCHESGEWLSNELMMTVGRTDPQGIGSAITYARRYSLMALCGVAPDDDDGKAAMPDATAVVQQAMTRATTPRQDIMPVLNRLMSKLRTWNEPWELDNAVEALANMAVPDDERAKCVAVLKQRYKEILGNANETYSRGSETDADTNGAETDYVGEDPIGPDDPGGPADEL